MPWLWLAAMLLTTSAAAVAIGHLPQYGAPDPKDLAPLRGWRELIMIALAPALIALLVHALSSGANALRGRAAALTPTNIGVAGSALIVAAMMADPLGVMSWFFD